MNKYLKNNFKITPYAIWIAVLYPIIYNILIVNFNNNSSEINMAIAGFCIILSIIYFINNKININNKKFIFFSFMLLFLLINNFVTVFTADNTNISINIRYYILPISLLILILCDNTIMFNNKNYSKLSYNLPILVFLILNLLGCYLAYENNLNFINFVQGSYGEIYRYKRYGFYQYSGLFPWPNHLAYSAGSIFILCKLAPINKYLRYSLTLLVLLSLTRSVIFSMFFIIVLENFKIIKKNKLYIFYFCIFLVSFSFCFFYFNKNIIINLINEFTISNAYYDSYRKIMLRSSYKVFQEHFIFGIGIGRISNIQRSIYNNDFLIMNNFPLTFLGTSDTFYTIIGEVGIAGITIFIASVFKVFKDNCFIVKEMFIFIFIYSYSLSNPFSNSFSLVAFSIIFAYYLKEEGYERSLYYDNLAIYKKQ